VVTRLENQTPKETFMATTHQEKKDFGQTASDMADQAKDKASQAASSAQNVASGVAQKVGEAASFVGHKAEDASSAVGAGIKSLGGTIRQYAPSSGVAGKASAAVADTLETGGSYLQQHKFGDMGSDLAELVRRNPIPAIALAVGAGFLLAHATRRA
jgi:hypothetical protein